MIAQQPPFQKYEFLALFIYRKIHASFQSCKVRMQLVFALVFFLTVNTVLRKFTAQKNAVFEDILIISLVIIYLYQEFVQNILVCCETLSSHYFLY